MSGGTETRKELQASGNGWALEISVDPDLLKASLRLTSSVRGSCPAEEILKLVAGSGLYLTDAEKEHLPELAAELSAGPAESTQLIAQGVVGEAAHQKLVWEIPIEPEERKATGQVDLRQVHRFINVSAGQPLCRYLSVLETPGRDVFGAPLPSPPIEPPPKVSLGQGVSELEDGTLVAKEDGCVRYDKGVLSVEKVFEVPGDVDYKVGNIDFKGRVVIRGNVLDKFSVKATVDVVVHGMVEDATIEAGGHIHISGGVAARHGGKLRSGGNIKARYLHGATVEAVGDVTIESACYDCKISAGGSVSVRTGAIIGGSVRANGNVVAEALGSPKAVATSIAAGIQGASAAKVEQLKVPRALALAEVQKIEQALGPYARAPIDPALPLEKQEQLKELLEELEIKRERLKGIDAEIAKVSGASIGITRIVYPNVTIGLDSVLSHRFGAETSGPIKICTDLRTGGIDIKPLR